MSNIEAVARHICAKQHRCAWLKVSDEELADHVDRYWHCIAADLESGHIDGEGNETDTLDFDQRLDAYLDWCARHPESKPNHLVPPAPAC